MFATACIQPIDMVKVRLQTGETGGSYKIASRIVAQHGFQSLYKGLSAGLLRQATYTTARIGLYSTITSGLAGPSGSPPSLLSKAAAGLFAGGAGALVGCPADVALVRMQVDMQLPLAERRGYRHVGDALVNIVKKEGVAGLFTGAGPTAARAMGLNMGMLVSNDKAKEVLVDVGFAPGGAPQVLCASTLAGLCGAVCSLPCDYVKTQLQRQRPGASGELPFLDVVDCILKTMKNGGFSKFYTGFPTYYCRIAPHAMITLIVVELLFNIQSGMGI